MKQETIDILEQIERCRRLATFLTDEEMRGALEALAENYEARLKGRGMECFMLRH